MQFRKAKKSDFKEVFVLLKQLFNQNRLYSSKSKELYEIQIRSNSYLNFVVKKNNKLVGYASVCFKLSMQEQGFIGHLSELVIDESFRGKGIGTEFLKHVEKNIKKEGCKELQLPSTFKRKKAHKFYENQGYKKTSYYFWKKI